MRSKILLMVLAALVPVALRAQEGSLDPSFNSSDQGFGLGDGPDGPVRVSLVQADGKILVGGQFYTYNGVPRIGLARLLNDGTLDAGFPPAQGPSGAVLAIVQQPDGKIIVAGEFTTYGGIPRNRIARLNTNGSLDIGFDPGIGPGGFGPSAEIRTVLVQPDGKILVGGPFTTFNGAGVSGVVRLNSNGSVDNGFASGGGLYYPVWALALQSDGKVLIAGAFTNYSGTAHSGVVRVNANGTIDGSFGGTGTTSAVYALSLQADGKILVGGAFDTMNGVARQHIARLNADGSLDGGFLPGNLVGYDVFSIKVLADDRSSVAGVGAPPCIHRLNTDGTIDASFDPGPGANSGITNVSFQPDGQSIIGGDLDSYNGRGMRYIQRVAVNGSPDGTFNPQGTGANNIVNAVVTQADGKILMGGRFSSYFDEAHNYLARLNADGSIDNGFNPGGFGPDLEVRQVIVQADGKIVISGLFGSYNSVPRKAIARLNSDGTLDLGFQASFLNVGIHAVALLPDGKLVLGGSAMNISGTQHRIIRLNTEGSLDNSFSPGTGPNNGIQAIAVQPDGKLIIGGHFTDYNGTARNRIARLNPNGDLDMGFDPGSGANGSVNSMVLQPDGKVIIRGNFTSINGISRSRIARLNPDGSLDLTYDAGAMVDPNNIERFPMALQPDGRLVIGGHFTSVDGTSRIRLARLEPDGSLDPDLDPGSGANNAIYALNIRPNGQVLIGGSFTSYNAIGRNRIARINGTPRTGIKMMLEGPYSGGMMNDVLRTLPSFPLTEPFTAMGYAETGYANGATIGAGILSVTGNNAIVDWVLAEMRPVATPGTVAASRAVLLQRDGDVVDLDGVSSVGFAGLATGNYCVAMKPRNHLPVMLSPTTPISYGPAVATVDFTLSTTQVYDNDARKNVGGVMVLAAGDVSFNENAQYTGLNNDRDPILTRVGATTPTNAVTGYWREDVTMDGVVKYSGLNNDRDPILVNVGSATPNNTRVATLP